MRRVVVTVAVLFAATAQAEVRVRVDPAVAHAVTAPARDYFGLGFGTSGALSVDVASFLDLGARISYLYLSRRADSPLGGPGTLLAVGPSLRLHVPWERRFIPWVAAELQYVRTGPLNRVGLELSVGFHFPIVDRVVWMGPWLGVEEVFRGPDTPSAPTRDTTVVTGGLSVEVAFFRPAPPPAPPPPAPLVTQTMPPLLAAPPPPPPEKPADADADGVADADDACPKLAGAPGTLGCPDRDGDAVADAADACPEVLGLAAEQGCPAYAGVDVRPDRLALVRSIGFVRGRAAIPRRAVPLVDEVARALRDRPSLCVRIEGHADAKSTAAAAQQLSEVRAETVRLHLIAKGVAPSRLEAVGRGATPPFADIELGTLPCPVAEVKLP